MLNVCFTYSFQHWVFKDIKKTLRMSTHFVLIPEPLFILHSCLQPTNAPSSSPSSYLLSCLCPWFPVPHYPCHYIPLPGSPGGLGERQVLIRWTCLSSRVPSAGTSATLAPWPSWEVQAIMVDSSHPVPGGPGTAALACCHNSPSCLCQFYRTDSHQ